MARVTPRRLRESLSAESGRGRPSARGLQSDARRTEHRASEYPSSKSFRPARGLRDRHGVGGHLSNRPSARGGRMRRGLRRGAHAATGSVRGEGAARLARDREQLARFRQEAEITSTLRHPHIVQVFDFNVTDDGVPYLVMELLEANRWSNSSSATPIDRWGAVQSSNRSPTRFMRRTNVASCTRLNPTTSCCSRRKGRRTS